MTVWYHQALRLVTLVPGADASLIRAYGARTGLPPRRPAALPRDGDVVAEPHASRARARSWSSCPAGPLSPADARRHARAVLAVAQRAAAQPAPRRRRARRSSRARSRSAPRAAARWPPTACATTASATARLTDPKVIVEHYTATTRPTRRRGTRSPPTRPTSSSHERPGVCAHFLIDRDGTITQLVPLRWRCRHTVGLNHVAIGIEHVGVSDAGRDGRPARSSRPRCALTRWLQARFGIRTRDVIGHAESLSSPYYHEDVGGAARAHARRLRPRDDAALPRDALPLVLLALDARRRSRPRAPPRAGRRTRGRGGARAR